MVGDGTGGGCLPTLPFSNQSGFMHNPQKLRKQIRLLRRKLSPHEQLRHSRIVAKHFTNSHLFRQSNRIALYLAADGELDPTLVAERARAAGKKLYLPILQPGVKKTLWFAEFREGEKMIANRFGIREPDIRKRNPVPPWGLDLILLPLVAFDNHGNRLGMGGGFYDRTLSYLHKRSHWTKPKLIGLAHECQRVEHLHSNHWDIPLQGAISEKAYYRFD